MGSAVLLSIAKTGERWVLHNGAAAVEFATLRNYGRCCRRSAWSTSMAMRRRAPRSCVSSRVAKISSQA